MQMDCIQSKIRKRYLNVKLAAELVARVRLDRIVLRIVVRQQRQVLHTRVFLQRNILVLYS